MARYICKCGRVVIKSTNADNTGNRDTDGCEGCPYLLPWGPMEWNGKGFKQDIQGYECRMSPSIDYASTYYGSADDKCTLRIVSLDLDFLDEVEAWIYDYASDVLTAGFSRGSIRGIEFSDKGRYSLSVRCAQNKKGMAAKAALIAHFFGPNKQRHGMTPEKEKAHILATIQAGKAAQRKKENMEYIISENLENDCVYAYAAKEFWVYDKQACRWYTSGFCREQYEQAKQKLSRLTPEDFLTDSNDYGLLDDYEIPRAALDALLETVKGGKREAAPFEDTNPTDAAADASPCAPGASDALSLPSQSADADAQQDGGDDAANPTQAAPASPADAGAATQSLSAAAPASLAADPAPAAFDFGADAETNMALMQDAQVFMAGSMARVMAAKRAHDRTANNYRGSWGKWCDLVGISRDTGDNMVRVAEQFGNIQINGQNLIDVQPLKLLYAASKASTPPEIREKVENLDITTHKQYQEAMAQLKAERQARERAEQQLADAQHAHQAERESTSAMLREEQQRRQAAEERRIAAEKDKADARRRADLAEKERDGARQALQGTKKMQEKWREKAESAQAQLDQLQAQPIPSTAIDLDEVERRVSQRLEEERAKQSPEDQERAQQDSRDAYDAFILAARSIDNIWKTLRPQVGRLGALQGNAKNMLLQQLMTVKEELIHECENCQSGS